MDFRGLSSFFGGCILPEDIRIDLERIYEDLEASTAENGIPNEHSNLLPQIIFYSLAGDLRKANKLLEDLKLRAEEMKDEDLLVRIPVYEMHLQRIEMSPPPLHFWSDRKTETRALDNARHDRGEVPAFHRFLTNLEGKVETHFKKSQLPKIEALEPQTLLTMWPMVYHTWNSSYLQHLGYPSEPLRLKRPKLPHEMGQFGPALIGNTKFRDMSETAFMMQLLNARKTKASGSTDPFLDPNSEKPDIVNNRTGNALRLLVIGDFQISSKPFTSPLALNLMLYAGGPGWNDRQWDRVEGTGNLCPPGKVEAEARKLYLQSFDLFKAHGCSRGMGAIHLRLGCISMMKAIDELCRDGGGDGTPTKSSQEGRSNAAIEFEKAKQLFKLDGTHLCIIDAHRLLYRILQHAVVNVTDLVESAQRIGQWGADSGNPRPARFAGMMFLRMGRRLAEKQIVERAWGCCVCARITFASLGDATLEAKAVEAQALYYHGEGHVVLARRHLRYNQRVVQGAFEYVAEAIESCNRMHQEKLYEFQKKRGDAFQQLGDRIFEASQDGQRWRSHLKSILSGVTGKNTVHSRKRVPLGKSLTDTLDRLAHWVDTVSIQVEREKAQSREAVYQMKSVWRQHQDAVRRGESQAADKVLNMENGSEGGFFPYTTSPQESQAVAVLCYQARFIEAREKLSTSLPPIRHLHEPLFIPAFSRLLYPQIQAHLWLYYITRDWSKGHDTLVDLGDFKSTFFEELKRNPDVDRWMSMVALGYFRFRTSPALLEEALEWYQEAHNVVTMNRSTLVDIQNRRAGGRLISPVDVYQGLANIGVTLHVMKERISPYRTFGYKHFGITYHTWGIRPQNIDFAVLFFEQGRAGVLADMVLLHEDSCRSEAWAKLRALTDERNESVSETPLMLSDHDARISAIQEVALKDQEVLQLATRVRCRVREATCLREWGVTDKIYNAIPDRTVVIHINTDLEQTTILYITKQGVQLTHQTAFPAYGVNSTVLQYLDAFRLRKFTDEMDLQDKLPKHEEYSVLIQRLSEHIVSPASALLKKMETIVFVPSRLLHNFPVSALTLEDAPLCESKTTYVCPSLQALSLLSRRRPARPRPEQATELSSPGFVTFMPTRKGKDSPNNQLDLAAAFAVKTADDLGYKAMPAYKYKKKPQALLNEMRISDVVLLASHGHVGTSTPWDNNLSLGKSLSVTELLGNTMSTKIVVLQACLSSVSGMDDGDDVIGFSHAVLSSGANSFIGALWEVNELAASLLISFFFEKLKSGEVTAAEALRHAQMRLRLLEREDAVKALSSVQEKMSEAVREEWFKEYKVRIEAMKIAVERVVGKIKEEIEPQFPFDHPYFWAPFVLLGYGEMKLSP